MRHFLLAIPALILLSIILSCAPGPENPQQADKSIRTIYDRVLKEKGGLDNWKLFYHPMIYAAWEYKGRGRADRATEDLLRKGNTTFWALQDDVAKQSQAGGVTLNRQEFLAIIPDQPVRDETSKLIDSGVPAVHAFARAYIESIIPSHADLPQQILIQLGKLYTGKPELIEVESGEPTENDNTHWRDWLHDTLAGCGLAGVLTIVEFDHQMDDLQKSVDANFWDGRLSIAYNLRSIQLARAQALEPIFRELEPLHQGGQVGGFATWMYYNLAYTLHSEGGLFPYSPDEITKINDLIQQGLVSGPLGDGEEAKTIADSIGQAPSVEEANRLFDLIGNASLPCERHELGYQGLAKMFLEPVETWASDPASQQTLRSGVIAVMEKGILSCGNPPLIKILRERSDRLHPSIRTSNVRKPFPRFGPLSHLRDFRRPSSRLQDRRRSRLGALPPPLRIVPVRLR